MTIHDCTKMQFLLQADHDGELDIGNAAMLAAHLEACADCRARQIELAGLSVRLRTELPYYAAPLRLRQAIEATRRNAQTMPPIPPSRDIMWRSWLRSGESWLRRALPVGAGAAIAAAVMLAVLPPRGADPIDAVVASHIRALQPGHLMDVVSTDQHTVKPWFDGKLDYAPPVRDLASQGFPLAGGRLDYLAGRPVAALAYHRAQHVIDLYVWPSSSSINTPLGSFGRSGYNSVSWTQDQMVFWAVSDLNKAELAEFVEHWQASS